MGNELGAGHPKSSKFSVIIVTLSSLIISTIIAIVVMVLRDVISYAFTSGATVASAVSELSPFLAVSIILNGVQPVLSGIFTISPTSLFIFIELMPTVVILIIKM